MVNGEQQSTEQAPTPGLLPSPPAMNLRERPPDFAALEQINKQREDFYERMIAVDEKTLGREHPSVARDLTGLAYVYLSQKKYDQARLVINRALQIYKNAYGADPLVVKRTQFILNLIDRRQPVQEESPLPGDYLSSLPPIPMGAQTVQIALRLNFLGLLCYSEGKIDDAQKIYAWALAATARAVGEHSMIAATCLQDYARVLRSGGQKPQAERFEQTANGIVSRALAKEEAIAIP